MKDPLQAAIDDAVYWLGRLLKAQRGMSAGKRGAELAANHALAQIDGALSDDVAARLDRRIQAAMAPILDEPHQISARMRERGSRIISEEMRILHGLLVRRHEMENLFHVLRGEPQRLWLGDVRLGAKSSIADLRRQVRETHNFFVAQLRAACHESSGRKQKKARKRDLERGTATVTYGVALVVGDITFAEQFAYSYSAGMSAIFQGFRDLWGDLPPGPP
jgi:hypothetical protein